jgi:translation initiation factor 4E
MAAPADEPADGFFSQEEDEDETQEQEEEDVAEVAAKKHELHHRWALWVHQRPGQTKEYGDNTWSEGQRRVFDFQTAEDFWCMIHYAHQPSKLSTSDYSLFRHNITPAWEDPAFRRGGRWVVKLEKLKMETLDELWVLLCLALIGEAFADYGGDAVCGAIVSVRNRGSKAALWLSESARVERVLAIGHQYRNVLAEAPGLEGLTARNLTFEYFGRQHAALELPELFRGKSTVGVFQ